jgi:hypothetical protein
VEIITILKELMNLQDKTVAIVGPAAYMVGTRLGQEIDGHDVVVRLNRGIESIVDYSSDIGSRTDILYSCLIEKPGNAGPYEPESLISDYGIKAVVAPPHSNFQGFAGFTQLHELVDKAKASRLAALVPLRVVDHKFHNQLAIAVKCKPNTGFMAIYDLLRFSPSTLSIYGFSFYLDGFIPGCKNGVEQEQKMSEEQFAEKCFNSKRHVQKNMWQHAKTTLLGANNIRLDPVLNIILSLEDLDKELFKKALRENEDIHSYQRKFTESSSKEL